GMARARRARVPAARRRARDGARAVRGAARSRCRGLRCGARRVASRGRPVRSFRGSPAARRGPQELVMTAQVGIIMGSQSDWATMKHAADVLTSLGGAHETRIVSAHRTPDLLFEYASSAADRGLKVIIAGAGGAAHLPGMTAAKTELPVLGVPIESKALKGMDSLLSIVQMPAGVPVGTLAIGKAGAVNAALLAAEIVALEDDGVRDRLKRFRATQTQNV